MSSVMIRPEVKQDRDSIFELHQAAFPGGEEAPLVDEIRALGLASLSLVAELNGDVVGHILFSPVRLTVSTGQLGGLGLAPLAVLPAHQRSGVGRALMEEGIAACRNLKAPFVVLLGDPNYYSRFEFRPASQLGWKDEFGGGDAFQALVLSSEEIPVGEGLVKYCQAFDKWIPE